jgi:hypothetical protein
MMFDCLDALQDRELDKSARIITCLIIFYDGMNDIPDLKQLGDISKATKEMFKFMNLGIDADSEKNRPIPYKLIDWTNDAQLVCSAVNNVANNEIRAEAYLHWWTFIGYYMAIGDSPLSMIVGIRNKIMKGKKLEKYEMEFKAENPQYFTWDYKTEEQREAEDYIKQVWNSGK